MVIEDCDIEIRGGENFWRLGFVGEIFGDGSSKFHALS